MFQCSRLVMVGNWSQMPKCEGTRLGAFAFFDVGALTLFRMARRQSLLTGDVVSSCARIGLRRCDEAERSSETRTVRGFFGGRLGVRWPFDRSVLAIRMDLIDGDVCELFVSWLDVPLSFWSDSTWAGPLGLSEDLQVELLVDDG
jgi:hypothetical protein